MKFHRGFFLTFITTLFAVSLIWDFTLYTNTDKTTFFHFLYNLVYGSIFIFGGLVTLFYSVQFSLSTNLGKMLLFFGLGLLSFATGNIIWYFYNNFLQVEIPFPSIADVMYISFYPLMVIGTLYLLKIYKTLVTQNIVRDSIIIVIISFIVIFTIFSRLDLLSDFTLIQKFVNVFYPVGDAVIIALTLIALRIGGGKLHPSLYIFTFGLLMQSVADLLFNYRNAIGVYWNGDIADLFFSFGGYFMSFGIFEIINNLNQVPKPTSIPEQTVEKNSV